MGINSRVNIEGINYYSIKAFYKNLYFYFALSINVSDLKDCIIIYKHAPN